MNLFITQLFEDPQRFFIWLLVVIFSICCHEFMHAWAALKQGDPTAADEGHLTLNPMKQMGPFSLVMLAVCGIAWGRVPVRPWQMRHRHSDALVSLAGPATNFGLFLIFGILFYVCYRAGVGDLRMRFEELKRRLAAEGLFDQERKRPIPKLPGRIGVVTSPSGAAIRDFLQIINRRFPNVNVRIYPCAVQGAGAAEQVARGVEFFNRTDGADVIVVTRGGGSMEDLWPFNEEILARAVASSRIPVVSAVGHEIDFSICDFAADLRVPTPSAAAELVIGRREEMVRELDRSEKDMRYALESALSQARARLDRAAGSFVFREPAHLVRMRRQQLDELDTRLGTAAERFHGQFRARLERLESTLLALDPRRQLERGYAILFDPAQEKPVTSAANVAAGTRLVARLADGSLNVTVDRQGSVPPPPFAAV